MSKVPTKEQRAEIARMYQSGVKLKDVSLAVGWCLESVRHTLKIEGCPIRKRGAWKKGIGAVLSLDDSVLVEHKKQWDKLDSTVKGTVAEMHVKTRLSELGFDVWEPFCQNHKTDLFILQGKSILRVQVKSATYDTKTKAFRANVTRHRRKGQVASYSPDDVDFFIIYCGGMETFQFYIAPASAVIGRTDMKVYPHRAKGTFNGGPEWERFRNAFHLLEVSC